MIPRRLRLWLAIILFIVAAVLITVSLLPSTRIQQVLPVPPVILPTPTGSALNTSPVVYGLVPGCFTAAWRLG